MARISIIGSGYVGLVYAAAFAEFGNDVTGVEQHPVAALHAFRRDAGDSFVLQRFAQMVGHGADLPRGAAGGDHHEVAQAGSGLVLPILAPRALPLSSHKQADQQRLRDGPPNHEIIRQNTRRCVQFAAPP